MKALEPVILVRELPPVCRSQRQYLPSLRELISDTPQTDESRILCYLGQGVDCGIYNDPSMVFDVLEPGKRIDGAVFREFMQESRKRHPHLMLTDGSWVWPGAALYYVAIYHIRLPERFLRHAAASSWKINPQAINREELNWDAFDAIQVPEADRHQLLDPQHH